MVSYLHDPEFDTLRRLCRPISFLTPDLVAPPPSWLGHVPFALWLVDALHPRALVELGTHTGNSYSAFCQAVKHLGLETACAAVDTWQGDPQAGLYGEEVYQTFAAFHDPRYGAFSRLLRMTFDEAAGRFADGSIDLLHIDGLHTYEATRHDFETWRPKLSRHAVVLFHDTAVRERGFGVRRLWDELSRTHPSFAFPHSNGLGVLGVGDDLPDAVRWLFEAGAENGARARQVQLFFGRLGAGIVAMQQAQERAERIRILEQEAAGLRRTAEGLRAAADDLKAMLRDREDRLRGLIGSTSWKLSAPVRMLGRILHTARRYYRSRTHRMTLEPLHAPVCAVPGLKGAGPDFAFRLVSSRGRCPTGWCLISYRADDTAATAAPMLVTDCGAGFSASGAIRLPAARGGAAETLVLLPDGVQELRLACIGRSGHIALETVTIREVGKVQILARALWRARRKALRALGYLHRNGWSAARQRLLQGLLPGSAPADYETWIGLYDTLTAADQQAIAAAVARLERRPRISVVMPVYNPPETYLRRALDTVLEQLYPDWELCIADDASTAPHVPAVLAEYAARDPRVKVTRRATNGHISAASNTALEMATGEFVALMDHDDELPPHALFVVAREILRHPDVDVIYSDEDKIDENGRRYDPYFKSDWNPDLFHGQNIVSHLGVFRRTLLEAIGGFRVGYEGSQDYDLVLRAVERTEPARIRHVPMVLYHWRVFSASSSFSTVALPTATAAARRALQDHFDRIGVPATVGPAPGAEWYSRITYPVPEPAPPVTLIVPTRDKVELLRQCVEGLLKETNYPNLEVLVLDNNSAEQATFDYFATLEGRPRVRVLHYGGPFNYSAINNFGVRHAAGALIGLINNDIKVMASHWLSEMVSHAVRPEVGAVGAKLYYGDGTIQHAGVVTGIQGVAHHVHKTMPREHPGYFGRLKLVQDLSCVTAACLVMRKTVYEEVGGLDEANLAVAFNDVDLCLRVREKGYRVVWTPHAELYHLESASRGSDMVPEQIERFTREIRYMQDRWGKSLLQDPFYNPNLTLDSGDFGLAFPPRVVKPWFDPAPSHPKDAPETAAAPLPAA